jgi:hydrogenase maturation protein HypF
VQGVGFRPFVYRAAGRCGVRGWVLNGEDGVRIHAEAAPADLDRFVALLREEPPPAAAIAELGTEAAAVQGHEAFVIRRSERAGAPTVRISPDLALCDDCRRELQDPRDRRGGYVYINCTSCGPRYSIIRSLPYDRPNTTMAAWPLCPDCRREYEDPLDRRFHAQPVACPACGPVYELRRAGQTVASRPDAIGEAAAMLRDGAILAVKGIGGYHLACAAEDAGVVAALRSRKFRKEKPFALMVRTVEEARGLVELSGAHERLLEDVARPIVVATAWRPMPGIAPDNPTIGLMLPYAPLHALLFDAGAPSPLVLTSANRSSEPIAYRDDEAAERLDGLADAFLVGQRPIARRVDDSVVTVRRGRPFMIRRARGYAPGAVARLDVERPILALGADLKNTIALAVRGEVFVSQHIGDLGEWETDRAFEATVADLLDMYDVDHDELTVVHDAHPQFVSTRFAERFAPPERRIAVQHHRAHVASALAEHDRLGATAIGVVLDGTGYGDDGSIWGGELFVGSLATGLERRAWLRPVRMPGGDAAARHPVQAAAGFLAGLDGLPDLGGEPFGFPPRYGAALELVRKDVRCFTSTSAGRLFDAAAALLGFTREVTFEGQAAIWMEHLARGGAGDDPLPFAGLDGGPALRELAAGRAAGRPVADLARSFHAGLAGAIVEQVGALLAATDGVEAIVLSGGCWQNELLLELVADALASRGTPPLLTNQSVPVNDGGISLGQAAMAAVCRPNPAS